MTILEEYRNEVEQFKRELRSYKYYENCIKELDLSLEEVATKLKGVMSPQFGKIIYENTHNPYKENKIQYLYQEEELVKKRDKYYNLINTIDNKLDFILEEREKNMIRDIYINNINQDVVARNNCYAYRQGMMKRVDKILLIICKEDALQPKKCGMMVV